MDQTSRQVKSPKLYPGMNAYFYPKVGKPLRCVIAYELSPTSGKTLIRVGSDPFDTHVNTNQVEGMTMAEITAEKEAAPTAPRKRGRPRKDATVTPIASARKAKTGSTTKPPVKRTNKLTASVKTADQATDTPRKRGRPPKPAPMTNVEAPKRRGRPPKVAEVVVETPKRRGRPPKATTATLVKSTAKKAAASTPTGDPGANPFRKGSNSYLYAQALIRGGVRRKIAETLNAKITLTPWSKEISKEEQIAEIDTRVGLTAHQLKTKFGWTIERSGRGMDSRIKAIPPK